MAARSAEIEEIIARTGDFAFKPQGVLDTKDQDWESVMPAAQRRTREYLNSAADKYYDMFAVDPKVDAGLRDAVQSLGKRDADDAEGRLLAQGYG